MIIKLKSDSDLSIRLFNSWRSQKRFNAIRRNIINNSVDDISSNKLLSLTEQANRAKEATGKPDKDVDETRSQSRGVHRLLTKQTAPNYPAWYFREIERDLRSVPVVDQEKVDRIKKRIARGNYQIDADVIAEKVMTTDELLA